jgi:hypothetical protein
MGAVYEGGCACGGLRYRVEGEPIAMSDCQCRQCQRESGTGHASHLVFAGAGVTISGQASFWDMVGDGGTAKRRAFCPVCGAPVYQTFPVMPDVFVLRAGSLDDPRLYQPKAVTWTAAAQPWDRLDPALAAFERMPV